MSSAENHVSLIADLDAFKSDKVGFKFNNVVHILRPVTVDQMIEMELARIKLVHMLNERLNGLALSGDDVYQRYFDFISPLVPSLTFPELREMTVIQLNNLLNLVFRQLSGDPTLYTQKKNPLIPIRGL
jgi:hypothetical protein